MKLSFFAVIFLSLVLGFGPVFACNCGQNNTTGTMDYSEPAKPISVAPGDNFTIALESNPTTGFLWELAGKLDPSVVKFSGSTYVSSKSDLNGAPGKEVWTFTAVNRGTTTIPMKYSRPWEKNEPPVKTAVFTVVVR